MGPVGKGDQNQASNGTSLYDLTSHLELSNQNKTELWPTINDQVGRFSYPTKLIGAMTETEVTLAPSLFLPLWVRAAMAGDWMGGNGAQRCTCAMPRGSFAYQDSSATNSTIDRAGGERGKG